VQSPDTTPRLLMFALAAVTAAISAACATTVQQEMANEPPTSVETLSYYPFQVKGYQSSYPAPASAGPDAFRFARFQGRRRPNSRARQWQSGGQIARKRADFDRLSEKSEN
jgi:hypothetical protein